MEGRSAGARAGAGFLLAVTAVAGAIAFAIGFVLITRERREVALQWQARLSAMANDRRTAIEEWLRGNRAVAEIAAEYPTTRWLLGDRGTGSPPFPTSQGPQRHLSDLLANLVREQRLRDAVVFRATGVPVVATSGVVDSAYVLAARRALVAEQLPGFFRLAGGTPIVVFTAPVRPASGERPLGVIAIGVDPATWLYPLLRSKPLATRTAETLLFQGEGDSVRFLSPLRFPSGEDLTVTRSLTPGLAARDALAGVERFGEYVDYAGARVLAATRRLSGAPWGLVAKVHREEAMAESRRNTAPVGALLVALVAMVVMAVYVVVRRQAAREALAIATTRARFADAIAGANDAILFVGRDGRIRDALGAYQRLYGYTLEELKQLTIADLQPAHRRAEVEADLRSVIAAGGGVFESEHMRRDGAAFPVEASSRFVRVDGEEYLVSIVRDVSERVRAQEVQARLAAIVEQSDEVVIITDPAGAIQYVNPSFSRVTGYSRDDVAGLTPRVLRSGAQGPAFYENLWRTIGSGSVWRGELQNRCKDGSTYWASIIISPVRDGGGSIVGYVGLQRDVTRERELDQQLRQAQRMEAVGQLTAGVAHDFNNLLGVILANAALLEGGHLAGDEEAAALLRDLQGAAGRGADLVRKLLAFGRRGQLERRPLDPGRLVRDVAGTLRRLIPESVQIAVDAPDALPPVLADPGALEQILVNLATNARDAMPDGGLLSIAVRAAAYVVEQTEFAPSGSSYRHRRGAFVQIAVSDTGTGMDEVTRARVFEPFFTTKAPGKGSGMGLAMVFGLVKQHEGYVDVVSTPGRGTTVTIELPVHDAPVAAPAEEAALPAQRGAGETILLAEDEESLRRAATRILERLGYVVIAVPDGVEALATYASRRGEIALIVSDLVMPRLGGLELLRQLQRDGASVPMILTSGYAPETLSVEDRAGYPVGFIRKPFSIPEIAAAVRSAIDAARHA